MVIETLAALDDAALARVWVRLNCWDWPEDFAPEDKPAWWDGDTSLPGRALWDRKMGIFGLVGPYIEAKVGKPRIQQEWERLVIAPAKQARRRAQKSEKEP